jgi:hypothetical protein
MEVQVAVAEVGKAMPVLRTVSMVIPRGPIVTDFARDG